MVDELARQTARGAAWSIGSQGITVAITFLSTSILARLISPEAFGMIAMISAFFGLGEMIRDFGLTNAVIQATTVSRKEKVNLFWLNSAVGFLLMLCGLVIAEPLGSFYGNEDLANVARVLSITFLISGMTTQPRANLIRDMRTRAIAVIDVISILAALGLAVGLAINDMGIWALVGLQFGRIATTLVATLLADRFIPELPDRHTTIKPFVQFGLLTFAARLPVYLSTNVDSVLIGRILGAQELGFYSRSYQLARLPSQQLTAPLARVMLPTLSRLKDSPTGYNRALLRSQSVLSTISSIGYAIAVVFAAEIIRILLGPGWQQAVPIFQVLALCGMIETSHNLTYWVFVSKGIPYRHLQFSLISRPVLIFMIVLAVPFGTIVVAWAYVIWMSLAWVFGVYWAGTSTPTPVRMLLSGGARAFLLCIILIASGLATRYLLKSTMPWTDGLITALVMLVVFSGICLLSASMRGDLLDTVGVIRYFRRRPAVS
jgi:PST family polysaccharide transporter